MKVSDLIYKLQQEDPERIVVMSGDSEGNNHSPLYDYWLGRYRAETTWSGEVGLEKIEPGYSEEDVLDPRISEPALILNPVN